MSKSTTVLSQLERKKPGPKPTGKGTLIGVRLLPVPLAALDEWIAQQCEPGTTRPEAIRQLVEIGLEQKAK